MEVLTWPDIWVALQPPFWFVIIEETVDVGLSKPVLVLVVVAYDCRCRY